MVIDLIKLMKRYEKSFYRLCDIGCPEATKIALKKADKWNRLRKAVIYQMKSYYKNEA